MRVATMYQRSPCVLWRRVGVEVLVADADGSEVNTLSWPAAVAWMLLDRPRTRENLTEEMAVRLNASMEEIAEHVERVLAQLEERGLVVGAAGSG
jgi:Coenzyme PQQ synthesis protein D (PqqD)